MHVNSDKCLLILEWIFSLENKSCIFFQHASIALNYSFKQEIENNRFAVYKDLAGFRV